MTTIWTCHRHWWEVTRAASKTGGAAKKQIPISPLQLEEQRARGHVFELARQGAPVPERGQVPTEPVAAPLGMLGQETSHLGQLQRADRAALNQKGLGHVPQYDTEGCRSPVLFHGLGETIQGYFVCFAQRGAGPGEIGRGLSGESRGVPECGATGSCQPKQAGPRP